MSKHAGKSVATLLHPVYRHTSHCLPDIETSRCSLEGRTRKLGHLYQYFSWDCWLCNYNEVPVCNSTGPLFIQIPNECKQALDK